MTDFLKALEDAQKEPDVEPSRHEIPDIFSGVNAQIDALYSKVTESAEGIPGVLSSNFTYNCARLTIGRVFKGFENGVAMYEDEDDSPELTRIMNMILAGKCLQLKKETTFLKDGAVVIWIEYAVQAEKLPAPPGVLSMGALLSGDSNTPATNP